MKQKSRFTGESASALICVSAIRQPNALTHGMLKGKQGERDSPTVVKLFNGLEIHSRKAGLERPDRLMHKYDWSPCDSALSRVAA